MDIIFKGRHTDVPERFRRYAESKLLKLERLDRKAIRIDVEVSAERNPRQADRRQRVELTIASRGPVIRAEAAADDRYAALDRAYAKLEERLRRTSDRRKARSSSPGTERVPEPRPAEGSAWIPPSASADSEAAAEPATVPAADGLGPAEGDDVVPIAMEGDGPLVVREKFHTATPMSIDQALLQMELVGHDFFLFRDSQQGHPSVIYRRHGYDYGVIRLLEEQAPGVLPQGAAPAPHVVTEPPGAVLPGLGGPRR